MLGDPLDGPANVLVDNDTIIKNSTLLSSVLQKKHNSISYHFVREAVAADVLQIAYIPSSEKLADIFTEILGTTLFSPYQ
jgi:uncharacterized membrane protein